MKVSIKTISEKTGFSPATVSNALNHKRGVNAETSAVILNAASELGYFGQSKITNVKFVIFKNKGFIVEDTPFFAQMIAGAEAECRQLGMDMTICNLDRRRNDFYDQLDSIRNDKGSAVILLGTELLDEDMDLIRQFTSPLVVVDYWNSDMSFNSVLIDNGDSVRGVMNYLFEKGHRKIGYLKGSYRIRPFRSREAGYRDAMLSAGLKVEDRYTVTLTPNMDGAYGDMKEFLKKSPELPTAFFADNDMIALGAMKAMWEYGLKIPDDVSVVGFDDLSYSSISFPPLTTVFVPKEEIGRRAVKRLSDIIQNGEEPYIKTEVCTQFRERSSVKDIRRG